MPDDGRIGAVHLPQWPPEALAAFASRIEGQGFDELWLWEDCFLTGGLTTAATALAATERIVVGTGLLPTMVRNPAIAAMEIGGLARMHPGRFVAAFGHGVEDWMRRIGARPPDRLVALQEVVAAVRALLAGDELTIDGRGIHLERVRLEPPPESPPPVLIGTTGERGLAIASTVADGVLLPEGSTPAALRWAKHAVPHGRIVAYAWLDFDARAEVAFERLRARVEPWLAGGNYPRLVELAGLGDGPIDDDHLRALAVAGDAADCASAVRARWEAGADSVVLVADGPAALERFAAEVLPLLRG